MCSPQAFSTFDKAKAHMDLILKVLKARVIDSTFWEKDMNVKLPHAILPAPAAKLKHNRPRSIEHLLIPMPLDRMILQQEILAAPRQNLIRSRLKQTAESLVLCELLKFTVTHLSYLCTAANRLR